MENVIQIPDDILYLLHTSSRKYKDDYDAINIFVKKILLDNYINE
jgi:hypothetical protein